MKTLALIFGVVLLIAPVCLAQHSKTLLSKDFDWRDSAERTKVAVELRASLSKLLKLIPAPTPSEIEWIEKEQAEAELYGERWQRLRASREFLQHRLKLQLDWLESLLKQLSRGPKEEVEMLLWCNTSLQIYVILEDFNVSLAALKRAGYVPKDIGRWTKSTDLTVIGEDHTFTLKAVVREIQAKILLAYLITKQSEVREIKVVY